MQEEVFFISYLGVTIHVTAIVSDLRTRYIVNLPTRVVILQMQLNEDGYYWREVPGGRTTVAEELGELIERYFE